MSRVHIRRALLLFAIVLGMAALVASLSRPAEERRSQTVTSEQPESGRPTATHGPQAEAQSVVSFDATENQTKKVAVGSAVTVEVSVGEPGDVQIPDLGLTDAAEPFTPASFEILAGEPGSHELLFAPADGAATEPAGKLVVTSAG
jgi:hypothetical protein